MKKSVILALCFLSVTSLFSQAKDKFLKDYVSRTWNAEDGIPVNSITDICQDKDGYIFFGTYSGLIRFDGVKFKTLSKITDKKYDFLSARSIMQDSRENFWVGSNDEGAFCLRKDGEIVKFSTENGLPNNSIRAFCEDANGYIWIGTASGIACVNPNYEIVQLPGFSNIPLDNLFIVSQLYCDTAGRIWIVTRREKGLYVYADREFSEYKGITCMDNPVVTSMTQDYSGAYWFGVAPYYAIKVSPDGQKIHNLGSGTQKGTIVTCIYQDSTGNFWFGLDNGITILQNGEYFYYDKSNGLADESVAKIIEDKEKNIWIATDRGGLQKLSYGKFQTTSMPTTVNAIAQDDFRKVIWLAGDNGLYCYKDNSFVENELTKYCKNVRIRHVSVTKNGALLVSTYEKFGQLKFNLDGTIESWTKANGLAGDRVRVAEEMSNGDLYIGTTTGLSIVDAKTGEISLIQKGDQVSNDYIMCLFENSDDTVWVGTDGGGIFVLKDGKVVKTYTKDDNLAGNVVFKITKIRNDEIWISTGSGVSRCKDGKISSLDSSTGFGGDGVFQLIPDFSERLWGTSNRGIFFVKMDDVEAIFDGKKSVINPKYFNRLDGITSGGVTSTSLSMKDNYGRIWFTLIDGFTIFDPVRNASVNTAPYVKIEDIYVDSEEVSVVDGKIVLPPQAKRLNINFTGISFISSEQILFRTKLEGFEDKYTDWTNIRMASYTNLKPGTYRFSVLAQNGDEVLTEEAAKLTIIKKPYLWQRPWFDAIIVVLILLFISWIIYRRFDRIRKEKERTEKLSIEVIKALAGTIDAKDKYTNGHSARVAHYSKILAAALGESEEQQMEVYYAALLHDIGKIGIPDTIINKPSKLNDDEYAIIKNHPDIGSQILSSISTMENIAVGARGHHERFDGTGYPDGKVGKDIPLISRILCVADAYDAMTSNRSYRSYMKQSDVRRELLEHSGTQFDPEIAQKMIDIIDADVDYKLHE